MPRRNLLISLANRVIEVQQLSAGNARCYTAALAEVLLDCVSGGASVGFMASLTTAEAESFFENIFKQVEAGSRTILAAFVDSQLVGTVQIITGMPANQPHRAEIAKLLVRRSARSKGVGARLMEEAERFSRLAGKTLLVLDTASVAAERLYLRMGWKVAGVIPTYALFPDGRFCDTTILWKRLGES